MAISGEQSTEIGASPEAVFAVASDLERYPEWQDFLQRVTVTERDADGRPTLVEAQADAKVTALRLVLRAARSEPPPAGPPRRAPRGAPPGGGGPGGGGPQRATGGGSDPPPPGAGPPPPPSPP